MKRIQSFFVSYLVLFSPLALAKTPMMATEILRATQKQLEVKDSNFHCHHSSRAMLPSRNNNPYTESFDAKISCLVSCQGKEKIEKSTTKRFSPTDQGLLPGDGSSDQKIIWRSLGITLNTWSKLTCLEIAEKECGSKEKIEETTLSEVSSGSWKYKGNLNCSSNEMIISPFDHEQTLDNYKRSHNSQGRLENIYEDLFSMSPSQKKIPLYAHHLEKAEAADLISYEDKTSCKHPIKVNACFGDCIWVFEGKKEWTETLSTPEYLGSDSFNVCADKYINKLSQKNWSKSVKQTLCEQFIFEVIRKSHGPGESCGALRLEADCSQL